MDNRRGVNSGSILRGAVKQFQSSREGEIGVLAAQHGRLQGREVLSHDYGRGFGGARQTRVLSVRKERQLSGSGRLDARYPGDVEIRGPVFQCGAELCAKGREFHSENCKGPEITEINEQPREAWFWRAVTANYWESNYSKARFPKLGLAANGMHLHSTIAAKPTRRCNVAICPPIEPSLRRAALPA